MAQVIGPPYFGGMFKATSFAFGCQNGGPQALTVHNTATAAGANTLTVAFGYTGLVPGPGNFYPLATTAPISVGADGNVETVTPSAVSASNDGYGAMNFTATFSNAHGEGDPISSATFGLQEALNYASASGGGVVMVDAAWTALGGTDTILYAATIPSGVSIIDNRSGRGGGVVNITTTLSNAQILALNGTPVQILPAPGATSAWDVIDMVLENKNTGVAYANGGAIQLSYGSGTSVPASATVAATFLTSPTAAQMIKVAGALASTAATSVLNKAINITCASAEFITGTGTMIVKVQARLLTNL